VAARPLIAVILSRRREVVALTSRAVPATGMISAAMFLAADLLGLGHSTSSFGETLALAITFLGIGVIANLLIGYAIFAALGERKQNQERIAAYDRGEHRP
jgi:flagellar motor component MotA